MRQADATARAVEAVLFAASEPLTIAQIREYVGVKEMADGVLNALAEEYAGRGIVLVRRGDRWHFETAGDLAQFLRRDRDEPRKLSRAGIETLAIIAYHEPVTRAEIESIRGVQISKGTLDVLMAAGLDQAWWAARSAGATTHVQNDAGLSRTFRAEKPA